MGREVRSAVLSESVGDEDRSRYRRALGAAFAAGGPAERLAALGEVYASDVDWHGPRPIDDCAGREAVLARLWRPLLTAFPDLERRDDVFIGGSWKGADWIGATGHYAGTFAADWLGIRATGGYATIRYGEFVRFSAGRVCEAYVILDLLDLMRQAGVWPLAPPLGNPDHVPGPATHDGVRGAASDAAESAKSLALVEAMIGGLMRYDGRSLDSMQQWLYWHRDFTWYGPAGIGTCRGQSDYRRVHQGPFLAAFPDRVGGDHKCRIADGTYVGSTGWPSIRATHLGGGFLGLPPTQRRITMRVMDFWRRDGELLRENWVFIDLLDLLAQMGLDVMARMRSAGMLAGHAEPGAA